MSDQAAVSPDIPLYAHPATAGRAESITDEGARWRWTGSSWELIDPPSTHTEAIQFHRVVVPLMERVLALAGSPTDRGEAVDQLWSMEGCSRSTLEQMLVLLGSSDDSLHRIAGELVLAALRRIED